MADFDGGLTKRGVGVRRTVEEALRSTGLYIGNGESGDLEMAAWVVVDSLQGILPEDCFENLAALTG